MKPNDAATDTNAETGDEKGSLMEFSAVESPELDLDGLSDSHCSKGPTGGQAGTPG